MPWATCSPTEKTVILVAAGIAATVLVLSVITMLVHRQPSMQTKSNNTVDTVCRNDECLAASKQLLSDMDESIDPCEDFDKFACSGFQKRAKIIKDKVWQYSVTDLIMYKNINDLLKKPSAEDDPNYVKLMKHYYHNCMDFDEHSKENLMKLKWVFEELGGFPLIEGEKWDESKFDWEQAMYKARKLGVPYELYFELGTFTHENSKNILLRNAQVRETIRFVKNSNQYKEFMPTYERFIHESSGLFGNTGPNITTDILDIIEFERQFAEIPPSPRYVLRNIGEVDEAINLQKFSFGNYLTQIFSDRSAEFSSRIYTPDTTNIFFASEYLTDVIKLIVKQSNRVRANVFCWNILYWALPYLSKNASRLHEHFEMEAGIRKEFTEQWLVCILDITLNFKFANTFFYENYLAKNESLRYQKDVCNFFQTSIVRRLIQRKKRITANVIDRFIKLIKNTEFTLGAAGFNNHTEEFYKNCQFNTNFYLNSAMELRMLMNHEILYEFYPIGNFQTHVRKWMVDKALAANWNFDEGMPNEIGLTYGLLSGRFASMNLPNYMSFGSLLFVYGSGCSKLHLDYNNYLIYQCDFSKSDDDSNKMLRRVVETFGVDEAYLTYLDWIVEYKINDKKIPGLEKYTTRQMFWISYANSLCFKYNPQSPEKFDEAPTFRKNAVNLALQNSQCFAKDFNCKVGTKMNPKTKCNIQHLSYTEKSNQR